MSPPIIDVIFMAMIIYGNFRSPIPHSPFVENRQKNFEKPSNYDYYLGGFRINVCHQLNAFGSTGRQKHKFQRNFLCSIKTILPTIHNIYSERLSCSTSSTCKNVTKNKSLYIALLQKIVEIIPHFRPEFAIRDYERAPRNAFNMFIIM